MKNYEEMSDFEINKLVARALDLEWNAVASDGLIIDGRSLSIDYCNNPSDAWSIITENHISIELDKDCYAEAYWLQSYEGEDGERIRYVHDNPLRAAMICFIKMKNVK